MLSQISLTIDVQIRKKYDLNDLALLMAKSTNLPIYSEQTNWEGEESISEFQVYSHSAEALDHLKDNKYLRRRAACIVGENFAEINGFWRGDKAGDTKVLIYNIPQKEIRTFLDSMKNIELLKLTDGDPFDNCGIWDNWTDNTHRIVDEFSKR